MTKSTNDESKKIILSYLLEQGALEGTAEGVARAAIGKGYSNLTDKQKFVLKGYFNPICEGDKVNSDCLSRVSDEEYVFSLEHYYDLDRISCRDCVEIIFSQNRYKERNP